MRKSGENVTVELAATLEKAKKQAKQKVDKSKKTLKQKAIKERLAKQQAIIDAKRAKVKALRDARAQAVEAFKEVDGFQEVKDIEAKLLKTSMTSAMGAVYKQATGDFTFNLIGGKPYISFE